MSLWETTVKCAVLFSDIAGSSKLYKQMGDQQANTTVTNAIVIMRRHIMNNRGTVIKTNGAQVMARFDSAVDAASAAIAKARASLLM